MADVATKNKSMNVVSNNSVNGKTKMSDVCGVQSNNGLIDLDRNNCLSNNASNNKLITLCSPTNNGDNDDDDEEEDDLILANNARNELDSQEDKSLQELIESELALRISANNGGGADDTSEDEASEIMNTQPEITKKIILEPRQDPIDINAEFIVKEIDHYTVIAEPYEFSNGHVSPDHKEISQTIEPVEVVDDNVENKVEELEEVCDEQTETTETEVTTTTTSGPSLPSAYEATELDREEVDKQEQLLIEEDQPANTLSDSFVADEPATDEDTSKELSNKSIVTADKHLLEEELVQLKDNDSENLVSVDEEQSVEQICKSEENTQEGSQNDLEDEDSAKINEIVEDENKLQENSDNDAVLSSATFIEHEIKDVQVNSIPDDPDVGEVSEEIFDQDEPISLKEASGVDEKACSFYTTEAESCNNIVDNDESLDKSVNESEQPIVDVTHYQLKTDDNQENIWITVEEAVKECNTDSGAGQGDESLQEKTNECSDMFYSQESRFDNYLEEEKSKLEEDGSELAPLATPDEISDISNANDDSESREEVITTSSVVSTTTKKKKKIESSSASDASPNHTKTKKTKKSKKSELEKENISVKSSFNKFDALTKKSASAAVLHVRSVDAGKVQQQLNAVSNGEVNPNCRSCGKVVFQMEQTKAEGQVWHKNCFRCVQCSKQLNVDNYESHEATLYCKPHFRELFQPKPVEEADQPMRPRKPEMIIRENQPKELPPDVVRASDKPDLGLDELSTLNVKSRFQVFEKANEQLNDIERSASQVQVPVKRSPSILSKLAKFQAKGMDIGVADEQLNGIPFEESSESEEEEEDDDSEEGETETTIVKAKRGTRERPMSFAKMGDIKNRWETTSQQGRRESQREARKEEIAGIRSRLFMGKQGKMKEMYQQAVADSERVTKINAAEEIQHTTNARSIKERFERGEPIAASSDDEQDNNSRVKPEKPDEEILAAGISRKSRSLFLELDATAAKTGRPVTPNNSMSKTALESPRRARDVFMGRQISDDVVRSSDTTEEVQVDVSEISNKFKFFESYREPEKTRKQFRITPPRDGQVKMDSPDREIYRDPDVVRADDRAEEVVRTDTARKMLSIFRQMEEKATKEDLPDGPKPLKRFTPPPEDKYAKPSMSDDDDEDEAEESEDEEQNPNYVRASDKVEDEFLKQAQNAARAKTLRAKFEHWEETTDGKTNHHHVAEMDYAQTDGNQPSIESASSLRARFESLGSQPVETPRTPKVKVNRFVEIQTNCMDVCESCEKKVYPLEKVETNNKIFHKQCFRCLQCNCILRMDTFTLNNGKLYCIPHFKQLFITRGNYDEGFGVDPHKNKWSNSATTTTTPQAASPAPIAVSNGDV